MGCRFSKENWCFSLTCCFCMKDRPACYWIGGVGLVWGGFATIFDLISANLPRLQCTRCLDYNLNHYLGMTGGGINAVQWVVSCFLIHGARKEIRWMLGVWLAWAAVNIGMQLLWFCITLPYTPSIRGFASLFQLVCGIHYFIVVKTHFARMSLTFTPPEEALEPVPPNSPARKHRRHKRRIDQSSQPPIRTLLGAAIKLQGEVLKRQEERETIEILAAGEEDEESEVEVLVVRRTSRGGGGGEGGTEEERETFVLQPIGARRADEEGGNDARKEGDEDDEGGNDARKEGDKDDEGGKEGIAKSTRNGSGRRRGASTKEEETFETDGMQEKRKKTKKDKKRKRREKKREQEVEGTWEESSGRVKERKKEGRRGKEERNAGRSREQDEIEHEDGDTEERRKQRKKKHKQRKEESTKRKKRKDENKRDTRNENIGSENLRSPRDEPKQGHVAVTIEDPSDTPPGKRGGGGAAHRGKGRLRIRLDSLESAAARIRRNSDGAVGGRNRRSSEGNAGVRTRRSSEGSVGVRTRRSSEGSVRTRRSSEESVGVRFRRNSEDSAGVCLEPRGPPSPVSPSHADVMVHWKLEMPQEEDPRTSSSLSSSPPPCPPPQRRPGENPEATGARRRPPSSPTDTGGFGPALRNPADGEGKREKFRIIEVKRKSQPAAGEPRPRTCSRRTSYKLAVGSPDTQETEIV